MIVKYVNIEQTQSNKVIGRRRWFDYYHSFVNSLLT